jgi:hypothetical protein
MRHIGLFLMRATATVAALVSLLATSSAVGYAASDDWATARYTVQLWELPNFSSRFVGTISKGYKYQVGQNVVEGPKFPNWYCETSPQHNLWRSVVLPDGVIGYTSIYCIF